MFYSWFLTQIMLIRHGQILDAGIMIRHIVVEKEMLIQGFSKLWMTSKYCHLKEFFLGCFAGNPLWCKIPWHWFWISEIIQPSSYSMTLEYFIGRTTVLPEVTYDFFMKYVKMLLGNTGTAKMFYFQIPL